MSCFNPRAPRGARRGSRFQRLPRRGFQSTRPARGATPGRRSRWRRRTVSIHAPRAGRDLETRIATRKSFAFQSTRPARGATVPLGLLPQVEPRFNPRAPRGARQRGRQVVRVWPKFQSTRPARGATKAVCRGRGRNEVSIHAPRAGRDQVFLPVQVPSGGFNPRAPRGARRLFKPDATGSLSFQSTRPARGATCRRLRPKAPTAVSIHAPRAGRDLRTPPAEGPA